MIESLDGLWHWIGANHDQLSVLSLIFFSAMLVTATLYGIRVNRQIANNNNRLIESINQKDRELTQVGMMGPLVDRLTDTLIKEEDLRMLYCKLERERKRSENPDDDPIVCQLRDEHASQTKSYIIIYLNLVDYIAYLANNEIILENHRKLFDFYLTYAVKIFKLREERGHKNQHKFWENIDTYSKSSNMTQHQKSLPDFIKNGVPYRHICGRCSHFWDSFDREETCRSCGQQVSPP